MSEDEYGKYSAIDGKQRLRAISDYIHGRFKLSKLENFHEVEGFTFDALPNEIRNALRIRPFLRVVTLLRQPDQEIKYEVFTRLNRGGEKLNAQELRNVAFRGALNTLVYDLAGHEFLQRRLKIRSQSSSAYKEMLDAEYVLRFLTLHEQKGKYSGSLLHSMDMFMLRNKNPAGRELERYRELFETALSRCKHIWGEYAFRRPEGSGWRDQTLAGMYDAQMLAVSLLDETQFAAAYQRRSPIVDATGNLFSDIRFDQAVRQGTNTPSRIGFRVDMVKDVLLGKR